MVTDCEIWAGPFDRRDRRPTRRVARTNVSVRRERWEAMHGPLPRGHGVSTTCGTDLCVAREHLTAGPPRGRAPIDMVGKRFGHVVVARDTGKRASGNPVWLCRCDCGNEVEVRSASLRVDWTEGRHCGCLGNEGDDPANKCWRAMIARCEDPKTNGYAYYGARGISVCPQWRSSFRRFLADMGPRPSPRHSIDRLNPDGNYEPGNCRWATPLQQAENKAPRGSRGLSRRAACAKNFCLRT